MPSTYSVPLQPPTEHKVKKRNLQGSMGSNFHDFPPRVLRNSTSYIFTSTKFYHLTRVHGELYQDILIYEYAYTSTSTRILVNGCTCIVGEGFSVSGGPFSQIYYSRKKIRAK